MSTHANVNSHAMTLLTIGHTFAYEMENLVRLFFPGCDLCIRDEGDISAPETVVTRVQSSVEGSIELFVRVNLGAFTAERSRRPAVGEDAELALARMLYGLLSPYTGIRPPWGILTGVRPVCLLRSHQDRCGSVEKALDIFRSVYLVSEEKTTLTRDVEERQRALLKGTESGDFSLYISIPFCPSRCLYCSFVSHDIRGAAKLVPDYVRLLRDEIAHTGELAARLGLRLRTVYMGGGTPTTLEAGQLREILEAVETGFDLSGLLEYTVEAGRPDTITVEKLAVLRGCGVDRISINPQTMNDDILRAIGRDHTAAQIEEGFALARQAGFPCINMDLIAGLPGDTMESFSDTVGRVLAMGPENVTVHTLTVKRSSNLRLRKDAFRAEAGTSRLLGHSHRRLGEAGYRPYYLYRQKGTVANLENTGYALLGSEGLYNVLIMEEIQTILAVGAGAVSKLCRPGRPLKRIYNFKYPYEYISRFQEILARKSDVETIYKEQL